MSDSLPPVTGKQLIHLLGKDGFTIKRRANHGLSMVKQVGDRVIVTIVPDTNDILPDGTLAAILGPKQTGIGKKGLRELIRKHRLK